MCVRFLLNTISLQGFGVRHRSLHSKRVEGLHRAMAKPFRDPPHGIRDEFRGWVSPSLATA